MSVGDNQAQQLADQVEQLTRENMELRKQVGADLTEERQQQCRRMIGTALEQQKIDVATAATASTAQSSHPLHVELNQLKAQLIGAGVREEELVRSLASSQDTIDYLKVEIDSISTSYQQAQGAMEGWRLENGTLAKERDDLHQLLEEARRSVSTEVLQLRCQMESTAVSHKELQADVLGKEAQIAELHCQLAEHLKSQQVVATAVRAGDETLRELQEKLEAAQADLSFEYAENKRKVEQQQEERTQQTTMLIEERDHFKSQCHELKEKLQELVLYREQVEATTNAVTVVHSESGAASPQDKDNEPSSGASPSTFGGGGGAVSPCFPYSPGFPSAVGRYSASKRNRDTTGAEDGAASVVTVGGQGGGGSHRATHSQAALYSKFAAPSMRDRCIQFYNEGQKEMDGMQRKITEMAAELAKLHAKETEMNGILSDRQKTVLSMCALGTEVQRQKEELRVARAQNTGLESTNAVLQSQLQGLLGTAMTEEGMKRCTAQLLEHAAQAAQASGSVLFDEGSMKRAMKEKQVLSHETQTLQREKERLQTVINHRQTALESHNGRLAHNTVRLNAISIGDGNFKISVQTLVDLVKELHPDAASVQDLKLKLVNVSSKLQSVEEEKKELAAAQRREVEIAKVVQTGLEAETDKLRSQLQSLQEECIQAHLTVQVLTKAKRRVETEAASFREEAAQTADAAQRVQQTGLSLITLLGKELEQSQKLKENTSFLRRKIVELESRLGYGSSSNDEGVEGGIRNNHLEWGKLSDRNVELIQGALQRHVEAVDSMLAFEEASVKGAEATKVQHLHQLVANKDAKIKEVTNQAVASGTAAYQKNRELKGEVAETKLQLNESQTWVATLEKKVADLVDRCKHATQQQAMLCSASGKAVFATTGPASVAGGAKKKPTSTTPATTEILNVQQQPSYLRELEVGLTAATAAPPARQVSFSATTNVPTAETLVVNEPTQEEDAVPPETEIFEEKEETTNVTSTGEKGDGKEEDETPGFGEEGF